MSAGLQVKHAGVQVNDKERLLDCLELAAESAVEAFGIKTAGRSMFAASREMTQPRVARSMLVSVARHLRTSVTKLASAVNNDGDDIESARFPVTSSYLVGSQESLFRGHFMREILLAIYKGALGYTNDGQAGRYGIDIPKWTRSFQFNAHVVFESPLNNLTDDELKDIVLPFVDASLEFLMPRPKRVSDDMLTSLRSQSADELRYKKLTEVSAWVGRVVTKKLSSLAVGEAGLSCSVFTTPGPEDQGNAPRPRGAQEDHYVAAIKASIEEFTQRHLRGLLSSSDPDDTTQYVSVDVVRGQSF